MAIWMAAVEALGKANQQASQLKIKRSNEEVAKANAKMQGNLYGMNLHTRFNKAMASDAVISASQNRRGGSAQAIADASAKQFNWDLDFADMSTEIQDTGYEYNINSLDRAADTAISSGYTSAALGAYNSYQQDSLLKPKDK